jgi:predicted short-subunit dehydrogenase-like oxidoreductase (DUF2520 family)
LRSLKGIQPPQTNSLLYNMPKPKPTVSIIGAGRVGTALAIALTSKGYPIVAVAARRAAHARKAISLSGLPSQTLALGADQLEQLPPSDLVLITTPDDVIAGIALSFAKLRRSSRQRTTFLHTSGALSSEVLSPLAKAGFHTGSMHPLVSISDPAPALPHCPALFIASKAITSPRDSRRRLCET